MAAEWPAVDAVVERAIAEAAEAIAVIRHPGHRETVLKAHHAIHVARDAAAKLSMEIVRARRFQAGAQAIQDESQRLIAEAEQARARRTAAK